MADDVALDESTSLSATDVAADDISGVKHQKVKVEYGGDDSATQVQDTAPLPVKGTPQSSSTGALSNATSTAQAASLVIKATPGRLFKLTVWSDKASAQFIQLHNATSLPADTAVPVISLTVPADSNLIITLPEVYGRYFSTGIVACNSSTQATKTISSADCWFDAQYL
jgi:hypothetical protein